MKDTLQNLLAFVLTVCIGIGGGCALAAAEVLDEALAKHRETARTAPPKH